MIIREINIAVIGTGELGSRHFQSLKLLPFPANLYAVDKNKKALQATKIRYDEPNSQVGVDKKVYYLTEINKLPKKIDLAIIASTSKIRRKLIENLLSHSDIKYLVLEKILFDRIEDLDIINNLIIDKNIKTFVNCPMRLMPIYKEVKKIFEGKKELLYNSSGGRLGMVTALIHQLDLLYWMTGSDDFELDFFATNSLFIPSKRDNYFELIGTILAKFDNGTVATWSQYNDTKLPPRITIADDEKRIDIDNIVGNIGDKHFGIPYQSEMTADIAYNLI
ncbi:MAG: hypothetical protein LBD41_01000 [Clostridiales Family XIII bacterium]|jgi:predicted dehydrogenase|nr:hypothetical protein [Clostridiales Family XIII bacterium]